MKRLTAAIAFLVLPTGLAKAADILVDASGAASPYTTIDAAMAVASPGDRILVLPGSYPAFQFSRGVSVIGLGHDPSAVVVAHVDYHVSVPPLGHDTSLSNMTLCGTGGEDAISISGNELAGGTLAIDGVVACGGVFLHGSQDFYLMMSNSSFEPGPGGGFNGAAFDFSGFADVVRTRIVGWDASVADGCGAGIALRISGGSEVRICESLLAGGAGVPEGGFYSEGAGGIAMDASIEPVRLRLSGATVVMGGDGAGPGSGGDGVAVVGTIEEGDATVSGGAGLPPGAPYGLDAPTALGFDPQLELLPAMVFGAGATFLRPGDAVSLTMDATLAPPVVIALAFGLDPPTPGLPTPLAAPPTLVFASQIAFVVPDPPITLLGFRAFAQGFRLDPATATVTATEPATLRIDF